MLHKILVQNFQCHERLKIEFDPLITTLTGDSDAGKSAVLRAIRWVCLNQPQGESFIRNGSDGVTAQLFFDDWKVVRKRSKSQNLYFLGDDKFQSFGIGVPEPIADLIQLSPLNFQDQHDPLYWLSLPAPEVSRQLDQVVDLGIIDDSLSAIAKKVRDYQQTAQVSRDRLARAVVQKESLSWVVAADKAYVDVERLEVVMQDKAENVCLCQDAVDELEKSSGLLVRAREKASRLSRLSEIGGEAVLKSRRVVALTNLLDAVGANQKHLRFESLDVFALESARDRWVDLDSRCGRLERCLSKLVEVESTVASSLQVADEAHKDLVDSCDGRCPVCGKEM